MRTRQYGAPALALVVVGGLLAGCGGGHSEVAPAPSTAAASAPTINPSESWAALRRSVAQTPAVARALTGVPGKAAGTDSAAAAMPAQLAHLFTEHVHLTGLAVAIGLRAGNADDRTRAALQALDDNAVALSEALGAHASGDDQQAFLTRWRARIKDLHIQATESDVAINAEARRRLSGHDAAAGRLLARLTTGQVPAARATAALTSLREAQLSVVRALRNHDDSAFRRVAATARELTPFTGTLAAGLDDAGGVVGDARAPEAVLRAELTGLMTTQLYQLRMAQYVAATNEGGTTGPVYLAAIRAAGDTTTRLGELVAQRMPTARHPFDRAWADLVNHLQAYATAVRAGDDAARIATVSALQGDSGAVAKALASPDALERALDRHIGLLTTALATPAW